MFKVRSVVLLVIAALITGFVEYVGLHRLGLRWSAHADDASCPPLPPAVMPAPAAIPAEPPTRDVQIGILAVHNDSAELVAGGRRLLFPGYAWPRSHEHAPPFLTTAVVAPGADLVAIAGICYGMSGVAEAKAPSCARTFVRLYRVDDGTHVRDLRVPWQVETDDSRRVMAMAFDARAERLAVLVMASWSDCSWEGDAMQLVVYRLADGARLAHRDLEAHETGGKNVLSFEDDEVHVSLGQAEGPPKLRVVRLRKH